jgi:electron transfer flavoprotein alpha subunit
MNNILAILETKENKLKSSSLELITEARKISEKVSGDFSAIILTDLDAQNFSFLSEYGLKNLYVLSISSLNSKNNSGIKYSYSAVTSFLGEFILKNNYNLILISGTSFGKEIIGRLSVKINFAPCPDVIDITLEDISLKVIRPIYAGKARASIKFLNPNIILTLRPNVFKAEKSPVDKCEIHSLDLNDFSINNSDFNAVVVDVVTSSGKLDVAEADRIISGGRGLRGPENFHLIEKIAETIGAATGASRAVVDAGWRPHSEQVGQTGKTVSPTLYIACGISGAIQHLAGMSSSKCIVAVNKDKDAPIFQVADYGIVGDAFEILPELEKEFQKLLN